MALSKADKAWMRKMFRAETASLLEDMIEGQQATMGGYEGATDVPDDDEAEGKRRIGFRRTGKKAVANQ